jgi:hypothetical protein
MGVERIGIERRCVDVHTVPDPEQEGEHNAEDQRHRGHDLEIDERLDADAADLLEVAGPCDAVHDDAEHDGGDDHRDQLEEGVAEDLQFDREVRRRNTEQNAKKKRRQHLHKQGLP